MLFMPERKRFLPQKTAFYLSLPIFLIGLVAYCVFCLGTSEQLFRVSVPLCPFFDIRISLGADRLQMMFVLFASAFMPEAVLVSRRNQRLDGMFYSMLFFLQASLIGLFSSQDFFSFVFFWQISALPVFFLAGIWGRQKRIAAANRLMGFQIVSTLLLVLGFFYAADNAHYLTGKWFFEFKDIAAAGLGREAQFYTFAMLSLAFLARIPVFPLHTWFTSIVPENQPATNIMLSGLFVPSSLYAFSRIAVPLFPLGAETFAPYLAYLCAFSCIYAAIMAWSSISLPSMLSFVFSVHFSAILMAALCGSSVNAAIFHLCGTALNAALIFALAGALESRTRSPYLADAAIFVRKTPRFASVAIIGFASLACIPCFCGFAGINAVLNETFANNHVSSSIVLIGIALSMICCINALFKIVPFREENREDRNMSAGIHGVAAELNRNEFLTMLPLAVAIVFFGIFPGLSSKMFLNDKDMPKSSIETLKKDAKTEKSFKNSMEIPESRSKDKKNNPKKTVSGGKG